MPSTSRDQWMTYELPSDFSEAVMEFMRHYSERLGIEDIRIEPGEDHEGDPVVYVLMRHRLLDRPINVKDVIALDRQLRDFAWDKGIRRFVHVRHQYDEKQNIAA